MSNLTFKRGQIEWALWHVFTLARSPGDGPPPVFKTRIKRLLDLDRDLDVSTFGAAPPSPYAFVATLDGGKGNETNYTPFDVFCLALALNLLDVGFKQGEIVYLMRHLREMLYDLYPKLVGRPSLIDRQVDLARFHPEFPSIDRGTGKEALADFRVFLLLHRIEMTEALAALPPSLKGKQPVFFEPEVCEGLVMVQERLNDLMPNRRLTMIVLEMTAAAQAVSTFLDVAPLVPRGRPRLVEQDK